MSRTDEVAAFRAVADVTLASSVSVSGEPPPAPMVRFPRVAPPGNRCSVTGAAAGSGHSLYGVGLTRLVFCALLQARNTTAPPATFWPAATATGPVSVTCVASGIAVITDVTVATVPFALVTGTLSVNPSGKGLESASVSVAVFAWSPVTVDWRGGHALL